MSKIFTKEKTNKVVMISTKEIFPNPSQPRLTFAPEELAGLAQSIQENGILQPLTIRKNNNNNYELISGERRLRAAKLIGMEKIPCIMMETSSKQSAVYAILENIQRKDLDFFEQARALALLLREWGMTQEEAAIKLGVAQSTIANKIRLLRLDEGVQQIVIEGGLCERHARALLKLDSADKQKEAAEKMVKNKLNVTGAEKLVQNMLSCTIIKTGNKSRIIVKDVRLFINTINNAIATMKKAGIPAEAEKVEQNGYVEYIVRIPSEKAVKIKN